MNRREQRRHLAFSTALMLSLFIYNVWIYNAIKDLEMQKVSAICDSFGMFITTNLDGSTDTYMCQRWEPRRIR